MKQKRTPKKKIWQMVIKKLDRITDMMLIIVCLIFFLIGSYAMYDSMMVYMDANDDSLLKYKPGYESGNKPDREIEGNMVAWLTIDDTTIDYPIMQGEDNTEYLNKNPFGDYALSGSIFLDSRNNPDFEDTYSLIYGHHMEHDSMFGALDNYMQKDFFDTHQTGTLTVSGNKKVYDIRIFALVNTLATEENIFAPTESTGTFDYVKQNAEFYDETAGVDKNSKLIAFSTCKYPDSIERTVVFAELMPH